MSTTHPRPIWTPDDFRAMVTEMRALAAAECASPAPVIDLFTGEVIA